MGQYFSGQHGEIYIKAAGSGTNTKVGSLKSWSLNQTMEILETTSLGATDRTITNGVRSFSGSASMFYYQENSSNVKLMTQQVFTGRYSSDSNYGNADFGENAPPELSLLKLRIHAGTNQNYDLNVYCYITSFNITCSTGEVVSAEINFEGHGAPVSSNLIT